MPNFSERNNLRTTNIPIVIRNDAQDDFRMWLIGLAKQVGLPIDTIRHLVCQKTYQAEDPNNWSPNEYMENEAKEKLPVSFLTDFISKGWEEVGYLKADIEQVGGKIAV